MEIKTSWGPIKLTLENGTVTGCTLPFLKNTPRKEFVIDDSADAFKACAERALHLQTLDELIQCFPRFGTSKGTDFQKAVWSEMLKIPRGQTRTYGEIAKAIGRPGAVRAVGTACGANRIPLFIPCHRVVAKNGLGGFGSGLPWKKLLLELEEWNGGTME